MVRLETIAALAVAALPAANAAGDSLYNKNSPVVQVDSTNYDNLIAKSNYTSIVEFYAPWCGHCKNLQPAFEKAAKSLKGLAKVAAVNCDQESNKPLCGKMEVKGFPTLKIVRPGKKPGKPSVVDYQGERTAKAIVDAVVDKIPNHVKKLTDAEFPDWVAKDGSPKAVLFTDKGAVSALLKSVAIDFLGALEVGQVRNKEKEAVETVGVDKFPTLVLFPGGGKEPIKYDGELKKDAMVKFVSQAATPNADPAPKGKKEKTSTDKAKASKASSKLAKSSASQKSKEAETEAASQTQETIIVEDPTDSPTPEVDSQKPITVPDSGPAEPIKSLHDGLSLQQKCLNSKAGTCVLALLPEETEPSEKTINAIRALSELHKKHELGNRKLFPFYQVPHSNTQGAALRNKLDLSKGDVEIIAINGKKSWWRHYPGSQFTFNKIEDWIDAIRMGDIKKQDVPKGLIPEAADIPQDPVEIDFDSFPNEGSPPVVDNLEQLKESLKGKLPEGMDYELEEISDEEYERFLNQKAGDSAESEKPVKHDEL